VIGRYQTKLIRPGGPWRTREQLEITAVQDVEPLKSQAPIRGPRDILRAGLEQHLCRQDAGLAEAG